MTSSIESDIAIIGAGPVGIFTVFQAGMLGMKSVVIDALPEVGGQCIEMYPEKPIYDIPGFPKIIAKDLISNLKQQAEPFRPQYITDTKVSSISKRNDYFELEMEGCDKIIRAKSIVIASGNGAFDYNRVPISNIEILEDKSLHYRVKDPNLFKGKKIIIAGGGDSAVDWAISLADIASEIVVIHRRDKFRAMQNSVDLMRSLSKKGAIKLMIPFVLHDVVVSGEQSLQEVLIKNLQTKEIKSIEADHLIAFFGLKAQKQNFCDIEQNADCRFVVDGRTMASNAPGIFAIGDGAHYEGKLKLILSGFAESAIACHNAYFYVKGEVAPNLGYSTNTGIPNL